MKRGRPTENRKSEDIKVRVEPETNEKLVDTSSFLGITKAELIRNAIDLYFEVKKF